MDPTTMLDPEIADVLRQLPAAVTATLTVERIPELRSMLEQRVAGLELDDGVEGFDAVVDAAGGLAVRILRRDDGSTHRPCVLWFHGGGFVGGNHRMDEPLLERWCLALGCVVVSVDYRLAPEHTYPAPLDDCYAALEWLVAHASDLGVDVTRIGVGGGSAGGGLAAGLSMLARDRGEIPLAFQLLLAPMLDDRQRTASSGWPVPTWDPESNALGWRCYLGEGQGGDVPAYAAPARAPDLAGLPPACIVVGGVDGFLDECVEYAHRLLHAGVPAELHVYPGAPHGFVSLAPESTLAERARADIEGWLATVLVEPRSHRRSFREVSDEETSAYALLEQPFDDVFGLDY